MSEPVTTNQHAGTGSHFGPGFNGPSRATTSTSAKSCTITSGAAAKIPSPPGGKLHPNQEVVLDEVEEGEMVENKLVIPDEMLQYLNQVADQECKVTVPQGLSTPNSTAGGGEGPAPAGWNPAENSPSAFGGPTPSQPAPPPSSFNQAQANLNNVLMSPQSQYSNDDCSLMSNVMSPQTPQHQMMSPMMSEGGPLTPSSYGPQPQQNPPVQCQMQMSSQSFSAGNNNFRQNQPPPQQQQQQPPQLRQIACSNLIGYFHRTDQSAHHCCLAMMMQGSLHINQPSGSGAPNGNPQQYKNPFSVSFAACQQTQSSTPAGRQPQQPAPTANPQQPLNPIDVEIQCGDISQSQMSPAVANLAKPNPDSSPARPQQAAPKPMESSLQTPPLPSTPTGFAETAQLPVASPAIPIGAGSAANTSATAVAAPAAAGTTAGTQSTMGSDTYQRTLEYVQNCQNWVESAADMVSSSTHPMSTTTAAAPASSSNLVINDMSTSLNSYFEEDRYLQMIQ